MTKIELLNALAIMRDEAKLAKNDDKANALTEAIELAKHLR